jgi:predicted ferric reductase
VIKKERSERGLITVGVLVRDASSVTVTAHPGSYSMLYTLVRVRWGPLVLVGAFVGLAASVLFLAVPASGWLTGLAVLAGGVAYAMMATNLFLAIRRPILERLFGPLDRVYAAHRAIGTGIVGVLGVHVVLIPIASAVERGESILDNLNVAIPLGVLGTLLLVGSIVLAHSKKVPYDRWQRVHTATGGAFLLLTLHMVSGASAWFSLASPMGGLLGGFALLGLGSFVVRLVDKARGGARYAVAEILKRERGLEVVLRPDGPRGIAPHRAGQFVFLTANDETHPFTVTSAAGAEQLSVLIRSSGDWTDRAQSGLAVTDRVRVDGPFGAFTPSVGRDAPPHQVWVAGGAGNHPVPVGPARLGRGVSRAGRVGRRGAGRDRRAVLGGVVHSGQHQVVADPHAGVQCAGWAARWRRRRPPRGEQARGDGVVSVRAGWAHGYGRAQTRSRTGRAGAPRAVPVAEPLGGRWTSTVSTPPVS